MMGTGMGFFELLIVAGLLLAVVCIGAGAVTGIFKKETNRD